MLQDFSTLFRAAAAKRPHLSWRHECVYTDAEGRHFHRLTAVAQDGREALDAIFLAQTGRIMRLRCRCYPGRKAENVTDLLLDALNMERL